MPKIPTSLQQKRIVKPLTVAQQRQLKQPTPSKPVQQKAIQQAQTQIQTIEQQIQQQQAQTETEKAQWVQAQQVIDAGKTRFWIQDRTGIGSKVKYLIDRGYRTPLTGSEIKQLVEQKTRPALQQLLTRRAEAIQKLETQQVEAVPSKEEFALPTTSQLISGEWFAGDKPGVPLTPSQQERLLYTSQDVGQIVRTPTTPYVPVKAQYQAPPPPTPRVQPRGTALDIGEAQFKPEVVRKIPDMPPKNITLKDVRWRGFFESSQVKTEANQTYYRYDKKSEWVPIEEAPPQIQDYVEQEIGRGAAYVARRTYGLFPEGAMKDVLFHKPVPSPRYTDLLKFIFFAPAMATGVYQEDDVVTFAKARQRGAVQVGLEKPKITTRQAETILKELQIRGETEKIREIIRLALQKGKGSKEFKTLSKLLENSIGKSASSTMIKDVISQEAMPSTTNQLFGLSVDPGVVAPVFMEAEPLVGGLAIETGRLKPEERVESFLGLVLGQEIKTVERQAVISPQVTLTSLRPTQRELQAQEPVSLLIPKSATTQITETPTQQRQRLTQIPRFFFPGEPVTPTPKPKPNGYGFGYLPFPERERYKKEKPYEAHAYIEATGKKPRWKKISTKPLTKQSAISRVADYIDNTISARGKVVPVGTKTIKGKKHPPKQRALDTGDRYFEINRHKFREWKQKKGVRTKIPNQIIEKSAYRLDKMGEITQIQRSRKRRTPFGF